MFNISPAHLARLERDNQARRIEAQTEIRRRRIPLRDLTRLVLHFELESDECQSATQKAIALWSQGYR